MKAKTKLDDHVQVSVMIPHPTYRALHALRLARCGGGVKLPPIGALVREALMTFVDRAAKMSPDAKKAVR